MIKLLAAKLRIKAGHSLLVLDAPDGFLSGSSKVDTRPLARTQYDFVLLFAKNKSGLDKLAPKAIKALKENSLFWIAYPKKTAGIKTDISRDHGWEVLTSAGFESVAIVALDETWSALRFSIADKTAATNRPPQAKARMKFTGLIEKPDDGMDTAYVSVPFDVEKTYGAKGQVKVKAWFDDYPYRGVLASMGTGCHIIIMRKDVRQAIGKNVGDRIKVELERDTEERIVDVPSDLDEALRQSPKAEKFFNTLSYTNRKEYAAWISAAKRTETREKRLAETIQKLLQGKKNPSQK
jgi:hypothetical protein